MKILRSVLFVVVLLASPAVFADGLTLNYVATSTVEDITPSSYNDVWTFTGPQTFGLVNSFTKINCDPNTCPGFMAEITNETFLHGGPPIFFESQSIHFFIEDLNFFHQDCFKEACSTGVTSIFDASFTDPFFGTPSDGGDFGGVFTLLATVPTGQVVTPEPASLLLMGSGILGILGFRKLRA